MARCGNCGRNWSDPSPSECPRCGAAMGGGAEDPEMAVLSFECPTCGAPAGEECTTPSGNIAAKTHAARTN